MAAKSTSGSCLCGTVRFSIETPTVFCGHCHCSMCRRNHGAGYVTWFAVPRSQFLVEAGESELARYRSSDHGTRSFCRRCGSSLFCESTRRPYEVDIVLANMHGPIDRQPEAHFFFDDRVDWIVVSDDLPRLGGPTGLEPLKGRQHRDEARASVVCSGAKILVLDQQGSAGDGEREGCGMDNTKLALCGALLALNIVVAGCPLLIAGAVGGGAAGAAASAHEGEQEEHSAGAYAAAVAADVLYVPAKVLVAGLGAVTSGMAFIFTLGDTRASSAVWNATVEGTYVLTPRHIEGKEPIRFSGA